MTAELDQELVQRIATLRFRAERAVEGLRSGVHRSPHRGASVIFAEHRHYRPGDDLRLLDWRAYARSDRHTIKRFEQETHLRAHLLLDTSASMGYGGESAGVSKREYAATLLAALAYVLLGQGDATGVQTLDSELVAQVPARARPDQLEAILQLLAAPPRPGARTDLAAAVGAAVERVGRRGLVVLASDLLDLGPGALQPLSRLRALGHQLLVFHIIDRDELELPFQGPSRFVDPEGDGSLDVDPEALRQVYRQRIGAFLTDCRERCTAAGARHVLCPTDHPVQQVLAGALRGRAVGAWA
ncbi:MAG: DUF58 domain-containing protein [Myxococcales bacterium]|nr:DUF58 domain-containing protein [Myxococcales bacterium]